MHTLVDSRTPRHSLQSSLLAHEPRNVWIVKPASQSRGRGIECHADAGAIAELVGGAVPRGKKGFHWVVQKYVCEGDVAL